jgi:hypothetical protein
VVERRKKEAGEKVILRIQSRSGGRRSVTCLRVTLPHL